MVNTFFFGCIFPILSYPENPHEFQTDQTIDQHLDPVENIKAASSCPPNPDDTSDEFPAWNMLTQKIEPCGCGVKTLSIPTITRIGSFVGMFAYPFFGW